MAAILPRLRSTTKAKVCKKCNGKGYIRKFWHKNPCPICKPTYYKSAMSTTRPEEAKRDDDGYLTTAIVLGSVLNHQREESKNELTPGGGSFGGAGVTEEWSEPAEQAQESQAQESIDSSDSVDSSDSSQSSGD